MVAFTPTEEQQLLMDTLRRFAVNDMRPAAEEADESSQPALDVVRTGWQLGIVPSALPENLGGLGEISALTGVLAAEELAYGDLAAALHILTPALFAYPLVLAGTDAQQNQWLPHFLEDDFYPATAAFLEPGIVFDPYALQTTASISGDTVTLNGAKAYVPLAEDAPVMLVYAQNTESGAVEAYMVTTGWHIEKREKLMGLRALPLYRVHFNKVQLPLSARLGGAAGIDYALIRARQQVALAALAVGVARGTFEYARDYAKTRVQFGKPIAQNQAIAFMLAEMAIEIDAARLLVWEAAWKLDQGQDAQQEAYLARQYADKMVLFVTDSGVQTLGGYGFTREYPVERWLRDGRGFPTFDGLALV